ncbi:hypothetical protein CEXT_253601 [Caerostris extrusa]|uniref:Uncharacterized protein n=1 Tax=Caerostris extrusa TaxID=172846 RepID=A0AAV4VED8_CAEEX|nr:hypothetical protein CEXT_253601 [Caerostris extrusa]
MGTAIGGSSNSVGPLMRPGSIIIKRSFDKSSQIIWALRLEVLLFSRYEARSYIIIKQSFDKGRSSSPSNNMGTAIGGSSNSVGPLMRPEVIS